MSAWKYKQLMPRVLVDRLRLMEPREILELVGKPPDYIYTELARRSYQPEIASVQFKKIDYASLERSLLENFIRTCRDLMECAPRSIRALIAKILTKFEASNVKAILRAKAAGVDLDQALRYVVPIGELDLATCTEIFGRSESIGDVVRHLSRSSYGPALEEMLEEYEKTGRLVPLEVATDRYVYGQIWKSVVKLNGLDGRIARTLLGLEIDSINVRTILRCNEMRIDQDQVMRFLIPISDVLHERELREAIEAGEVMSALESLLRAAKINLARDHQYLVRDLINEYETHKSLSRLETVLDRGLLRTGLRMVRRYTPFFNIGSILAFLNSKWFETRNIQAIIKGAEEKIPPTRVAELLILPS